MTATRNKAIFAFLKAHMAQLAKSRSDSASILGYNVENPSRGKFIITVATPKALYGAGNNVYFFINGFMPFLDFSTESGVVGDEKFTKYIIEA